MLGYLLLVSANPTQTVQNNSLRYSSHSPKLLPGERGDVVKYLTTLTIAAISTSKRRGRGIFENEERLKKVIFRNLII